MDGLGSITDLTDSNGAVFQSYVYDSFGNIALQVGATVNPYTYTGRERDTESGLYYYRARYYDAVSGRFTREDPIGFTAGDLNLYRYVQNNSVNLFDPNGLDVYKINRQLGGDKSRSAFNPLTHTFVFSTENGVVENTYSWGNTYDNRGNGEWSVLADNDKSAAIEGLKNGDAVRIGDENFEKKIEEAFNDIINNPNHPSRNHGWSLFNNCKNEANNLIQDAKAK